MNRGDETTPKPQALHKTHKVAFALLKEHLPEDSLVLDAGCGEGAFSQRLLSANYRLVALDIFPQRFKLKSVPLVQSDLNSSLPFPDATFDSVIAIEVLEHLYNWHTFFSESCRILKPNGLLLVSLPNILNLSSRLKFLFCGYPSLYSRTRLLSDQSRLHVSLIPAPFLLNTAERIGFSLIRIAGDKLRRSSIILFPLFPFTFIITRLLFPDSYDPLTFKPFLLFSRTLLALFKKLSD
ncbi:MAG: class I SAM-dependent methyltransferase [Planctomycetota bacterium]|nr:class I SAM-dependent methyltransferase [Planctomycetota bacterium]